MSLKLLVNNYILQKHKDKSPLDSEAGLESLQDGLYGEELATPQK